MKLDFQTWCVETLNVIWRVLTEADWAEFNFHTADSIAGGQQGELAGAP